MLLRSHREIAFHKKIEREAAEKHEAENMLPLNWNMPRPTRKGPVLQQGEELPIAWNVPDAIRHPISDEDIARKEKELEDLKNQLAKEEAEAVAKNTAEESTEPLECGSPTAAFPRAAKPQTKAAARPPHSTAAPTAEEETEPHPVGQPPEQKIPPPAPRLPDLNHFYPRDPQMVAAGLQEPRLTQAPPPDAEELRWRALSRRYAPLGRRR